MHDHIADRQARAGPGDKGALRAIASCGPPFVFDRKRPIDHVQLRIVVRMVIQEPRQSPVQRRQRQSVVETGAVTGRLQFQGRIFQ